MLREEIISMMLPYPDRGERLVRVYLPTRREGQRFPVVYMTDGQNLFDEESSGFGCWHCMEAVRSAQAAGLGGAVIVGVHNTDPTRQPELTPISIGPPLFYPTQAEAHIEPSGESFETFLVHTLIPAAESRFPVLSGRRNRVFCGSSMGGLMALFTGLRHPDIWSAVGAFSPALLRYRREDLEAWLRSRSIREHPFLWLYSGAGDQLERLIDQSTREAELVLREIWPHDRLLCTYCPELRHHETAWEPQFRAFLAHFLKELA